MPDTSALTGDRIVTIRVNGKVNDLCGYTVHDESGAEVGIMRGNHPFGYSDYIDLRIDVATGTILDWNPANIRDTIIAQIDGE